VARSQATTRPIWYADPQECAVLLRAYSDAGVERVFIWPVADPEQQLERFLQDVVPLV
jgi:hypothetical protein